MKYLSVCSGIEAATVAWHPLGWQPVAFGEIEKFPCQVLEHHYPDTPNWGDMTKFKEWPDADVNVFVGGTPCQSFSVAGLRKGLDDPRGNLMLTYLAIAARYRPRWLVWENVPGVLSSNGGLDFASLLRGMGELGYGFAYRILDAQYFGVAQRRRRVFVVGYLGNWRPAAAVLFERHSLSGNPAPSREKREKVAATITTRTGVSRNNHEECVSWPAEISSTLNASFGKKMGLENQHINADCPMFVPTKAFYESSLAQYREDDIAGTTKASGGVAGGGSETFIAQPIATHDVAGTMLSRNTSGGFSNSIDHAAAGYMALQPIALAENTIGRKPENGGNGDGFTEEGPMYTLNATGVHGVAHSIGTDIYNGAITGDVAVPLTNRSDETGTGPTVMQPVGFDSYNLCETGDVTQTLKSPSGGVTESIGAVMQAMAVRRLTPVECERLQGFPDNYTDIKPKGKATPDGPRYKALGNSMAVPVMAWIGKRIQEVDAICQTQKQ